MNEKLKIKSPLLAGLLWGILGGLLMVSIFMMTKGNGLLILVPYAVFLIAAALSIKLNEGENKYLKLFLTGLWTFMVITFVLYAYMLFIENPAAQQIPLLSHLWRLVAMAGIGAASSGTLTFLVTRKL